MCRSQVSLARLCGLAVPVYLGDVGDALTSPQTIGVTVLAQGTIDVVVYAIAQGTAPAGSYKLSCRPTNRRLRPSPPRLTTLLRLLSTPGEASLPAPSCSSPARRVTTDATAGMIPRKGDLRTSPICWCRDWASRSLWSCW